MLPRETYYAALFALLETLGKSNGGPFVEIGRKVKLLNSKNAGDLPALYMAVDHQSIGQRRGQPPMHTLGAVLYVYASNPDREISADLALNGYLDQIEAAFAPDPVRNVLTLGGLVSHCWVEGTVEVYAGPLGQLASAIVPVKMLVP